MRPICTYLACVLAVYADAQCGMTTILNAGWSGGAGCGSYSITVNTTGGVAPYSIALSRTGGPIQTFTGDADGDISFSDASTLGHAPPGWSMVHVQVTDVNGCTAVADDGGAPYHDVYPFNSGASSEVDCMTGQRTIWIDAVSGGACPWSTMPYTLSGAGGFYQTGSAFTWPIVGSRRVSTFTLPPGNYTFEVGSWTDCAASDGQQLHECYLNASNSLVVPQPGITLGDCGANVSIRAALQGALPSGTIMYDSLRTRNLIPTTEPYSALGYSYTAYSGATTISASQLTITGNNAIVDWMIVELRNSSNSAHVLFSKPALLQRDGDVVDLDGDSYVNFPSATGSYFVALRHRNHLGAMTIGTRNLTATPTSIDFRLSSTACYGTSARAAVGSVQCLWSGDANGDGSLKYTGTGNDRDPLLIAIGSTTPNNTVSNVYDRRDTNLDGVIKYTGTANDRDIILINVGSTTPNNTRTQQLP